MAVQNRKSAGRVDREKKRYWSALIAGWRKSGLSQRAYCAERGVPAGTFAWWKHRLAHRGASTEVREGAVVEFLPVTMRGPGSSETAASREMASSGRHPDSPAPAGLLELVLPSGVVVRVGPECDPLLIGRILSILGVGSC